MASPAPASGRCEVSTTKGGRSAMALSSAPLAIAFFRVSVRSRPGREPWTLPLYSNQTMRPEGLTASRSISMPTTDEHPVAHLVARGAEQEVALVGELA